MINYDGLNKPNNKPNEYLKYYICKVNIKKIDFF